MIYDDEMLQQINNSTNLFAYVQNQGFVFTKRNGNYFTNCPFHTDNTPSLSFSPKRNSFCCFSCGVKGQMIGYLIKFEHLEFDEAVEKAAKIAQIDTSKLCHSKTVSYLKNYRSLLLSQKPKEKIVHPIIPNSTLSMYNVAEIKEWLDEGISQEMIDLFGIRVDEFGNRIVYPVYDIDDNLINIKGRTRYEDYKQFKLAKYINYFPVGVMDYFQCLNITLQDVKAQNEIIIFESIKSVMKAYQWGYKHCCSAEKHNLTPQQTELLAKLKVNIVFAYDSDVDYGKEDVWESINKLKRVTNVYIIEDKEELLGGAKSKNSPVDCGKEIWEELYLNKRKVV